MPAKGGSRFREPAGGGSRCRAFRGSASNQLGFPLYSSTLRCRTNIIMAKVPGAVDLRGRDPCTMLAHVIIRLKPSDSLPRCCACPPRSRLGTIVG